jgi:hypothetical protein
MAASRPLGEPNTTTSEVTDCPQCQTLCVGALLLPCGHLTCRKCLREAHRFTFRCAVCQHELQLTRGQGSESFADVIQQLGVDPVMVEMVSDVLQSRNPESCLFCPNDSTTLCTDCKEQYCSDCATKHTRQGIARDNELQVLTPQDHRTPQIPDAVPPPQSSPS